MDSDPFAPSLRVVTSSWPEALNLQSLFFNEKKCNLFVKSKMPVQSAQHQLPRLGQSCLRKASMERLRMPNEVCMWTVHGCALILGPVCKCAPCQATPAAACTHMHVLYVWPTSVCPQGRILLSDPRWSA